MERLGRAVKIRSFVKRFASMDPAFDFFEGEVLIRQAGVDLDVGEFGGLDGDLRRVGGLDLDWEISLRVDPDVEGFESFGEARAGFGGQKHMHGGGRIVGLWRNFGDLEMLNDFAARLPYRKREGAFAEL